MSRYGQLIGTVEGKLGDKEDRRSPATKIARWEYHRDTNWRDEEGRTWNEAGKNLSKEREKVLYCDPTDSVHKPDCTVETSDLEECFICGRDHVSRTECDCGHDEMQDALLNAIDSGSDQHDSDDCADCLNAKYLARRKEAEKERKRRKEVRAKARAEAQAQAEAEAQAEAQAEEEPK